MPEINILMDIDKSLQRIADVLEKLVDEEFMHDFIYKILPTKWD